MARSFLTAVNLNQNELQNGRLQNLAAAPGTPVSGQVYYDTVLLASYVYNGSAWVATDASKLSGTIPNSALTTNPLARANHTGTQLAATISDFATTAQGYHLNQFAVPTANVPMGGFKLTGLNTAPSGSGDSAEYSWVIGRNLNTIATATANSANVPMGGFTLTGLATPSATGQAAEYTWVIGRNLNTIANATANTANVPMGGFKLTGLSTSPSGSGDSAEYSWVLGRPLSAFAAPAANIAMASFKLTGLATPSGSGDSAEYSWVLSRPLSAFASPAGNIAMAGFKLTGLATPTTAGDSAEYSWVIGQVQSAAAGIASKPPVDCIATANITLSGLQTIDGYTTLATDRVLVAGQTTASANGVYNAAAGAWTRTTIDGAAPGELETGAMWMVQNGTTYAGSQWRLATTGTITVGTTSLSIVQFGAASLYSAGNGITFTGTVVSANPASGGGISVAAGGISVDTAIVARKYSTAIGDGTTTAIVITHSLGTQDVHIQVRQATTPYAVVECDMAATSTTTATLTFVVAPTTGQYRVTVVG